MSYINDASEGEKGNDGDFIRSVMGMGKEALKLLYRLNTDEITLDQFVEGMASLNAADLLSEYWAYDKGDERAFDVARQILWLISSLESDAYNQFELYGITAFHEDFRELRDYLLTLEKYCGIKL